MADWVSELDKLSKNLGEEMGDKAISAIKEQIDYESEEYFKYLQKNTPQNTGELANSLTKTKINETNRYGYRIEYTGNYANGTAHEKIANILNFGTRKVIGKYFRTKATRRLRGLDERIAIRYKLKLEE